MDFTPTARSLASVPLYKLSAMVKGTPGTISIGKQSVEVVRVKENIFIAPNKIDSRFQFFAFAEGFQIQTVASAADYQQLKDQLREVEQYEPKAKRPRAHGEPSGQAGNAGGPKNPVRHKSPADDKGRRD